MPDLGLLIIRAALLLPDILPRLHIRVLDKELVFIETEMADRLDDIGLS